mmetsp:Transcript_139155/g.388231  ORF Transcript_139155/g.388231 Transcript_139155/m.388231 type:complete len:94 (-) Transcript_139155:264-545(-)
MAVVAALTALAAAFSVAVVVTFGASAEACASVPVALFLGVVVPVSTGAVAFGATLGLLVIMVVTLATTFVTGATWFTRIPREAEVLEDTPPTP